MSPVLHNLIDKFELSSPVDLAAAFSDSLDDDVGSDLLSQLSQQSDLLGDDHDDTSALTSAARGGSWPEEQRSAENDSRDLRSLRLENEALRKMAAAAERQGNEMSRYREEIERARAVTRDEVDGLRSALKSMQNEVVTLRHKAPVTKGQFAQIRIPAERYAAISAMPEEQVDLMCYSN